MTVSRSARCGWTAPTASVPSAVQRWLRLDDVVLAVAPLDQLALDAGVAGVERHGPGGGVRVALLGGGGHALGDALAGVVALGHLQRLDDEVHRVIARGGVQRRRLARVALELADELLGGRQRRLAGELGDVDDAVGLLAQRLQRTRGRALAAADDA